MKGFSAILGLVYALALGGALGLGLTWWATGADFQLGALRFGPWTAWPLADPLGADRYSRARIARSGDLPLGPGEGLAFTAWEDSAGRALDGTCRYRLSAMLPQARWWTLSLYDRSDRLARNPSNRAGFTSASVLRGEEGRVTVTVAPDSQPGNWLPSSPGPMSLILRLYDSPISTGLATEFGAGRSIAVPAIERLDCVAGGPP
ncbi:DUF1214 domain-containing protein [Labrys portucalensis]|uniref:DUF1214 domain-containing protein n=1 Tax=Labrys neptuniae TaxID=376174 RepID=A0ABV3PKR0_9HYPH|nr:DUF1214 domain-containing protein [Labrys neptuniae]MDT3376254.1 DUF1214 domain-containing protein [Labrys neptuniae]